VHRCSDQEPETFELTERHPPAPVAASLDEVTQAAAGTLPLASHAVDLGDKTAAAEAPPFAGRVSSTVDSPVFTPVSGAIATALTTSAAEQRLPALPLGLPTDNRRLTSSNSRSTESAAVIVHRGEPRSNQIPLSGPEARAGLRTRRRIGSGLCVLPFSLSAKEKRHRHVLELAIWQRGQAKHSFAGPLRAKYSNDRARWQDRKKRLKG